MRILLGREYLCFGGCESHLFTLGAAHLRAGHDTWIWTGKTGDGRTILQAQWCGFPVERIFTSTPLGSVLDVLRPDIIDWSHTPGALPTGSVPVLATVHSNWYPEQAATFSRRVVCVESWTRDRFYPNSKVIPNMVDLSRFKFQPGGEGVMWAGRTDNEVISPARELIGAGINVDCYGSKSSSMVLGVPVHAATDLASVYPKYKALLGASQVIIEGMATGRYCFVAMDVWKDKGFQKAYDGMVFPWNAEGMMEYNYRGLTRPGWETYVRDPLVVKEDIDRVIGPQGIYDEEILFGVRGIREKNREHVERYHDANKNAALFRTEYEKVIGGS